jgi:hypothetical protein
MPKETGQLDTCIHQDDSQLAPTSTRHKVLTKAKDLNENLTQECNNIDIKVAL